MLLAAFEHAKAAGIPPHAKKMDRPMRRAVSIKMKRKIT
jgi:hypothetical protein